MKSVEERDVESRWSATYVCDCCHRRVRVSVRNLPVTPPRDWIVEYSGKRQTCSGGCSAVLADRANNERDESAAAKVSR